MTLSDLIQYAIIAVIAAYSVWRLARSYLKPRAPSADRQDGGCGSGEGCGSCKGCASLSLPSEPSPKA